MFKNTFDLLVISPEKQVRQCWANVISHTLRICLTRLSAESVTLLSVDESGSYSPGSSQELALNIRRLITALLNLLYTEVAKNWMKFQQYFEFFRELASNSESFLEFVVNRDVPAMFLDLYLERKSPVAGFPEKKHTLGNRYYPAQTESQTACGSHRQHRDQGQGRGRRGGGGG